MTPQPPVTSPTKGRRTPAQPVNPNRPDLSTFTPEQQIAMRQIYDVAVSIRDSFTPTNLYVKGDPTGDPILVLAETTPTDVGTSIGLTVVLTRPGTWFLMASVCLQAISDTGENFALQLVVGSSPVAPLAIVQPSGDGIQIVSQIWQVNSLFGNEVCVLWMKKENGASGTSVVLPQSSSLAAAWAGP